MVASALCQRQEAPQPNSRMIYTDFSTEQLKQRLFLKAMNNSTPKKYAGDMLEAAEVIQQLQAKIKRLETSQD